METYHLKVAGLERDLPVCPLGNGVSIAGFVMFSDVELTIACATEPVSYTHLTLPTTRLV